MNGPTHTLTPWLAEKFISAAPSAAAKALETLATHEAVLLLRPLKAESVVACVNPMDSVKAAAVLRRFPSRQAAHILERLDVPQAAKIYQAFSVPQREKMNTLLTGSFRQALQQAAAWPPQSAGARMNRDFLSFKTDANISDIVARLKTLPRKKLPAACLVCSKDGKVKGFIRTAELAFYPASAAAGSVMTEVRVVFAKTPACEAAPLIDQGQPVVPVTDGEGIVLGVLTLVELSEVSAPKKRFGWF